MPGNDHPQARRFHDSAEKRGKQEDGSRLKAVYERSRDPYAFAP